MPVRHLVRDRTGAAAAEMALVLPLLLAIMFGFAELGRYFWTEHVMVKAVRDGAIYASRQRIDNFNCATGVVSAPVVNSTKELVRTGALSAGTPLVENWGSNDTIFTMTVACVTSAGGTTINGIYTGNGGQVPVLTINASIPYSTIMGLRGGLKVGAVQQATVMGA